MGSRTLAVAMALAVGLSSASAWAAPTAAERETARRLMDEGKARTRAHDLEGALEAYEKAHAIMHVPTTGMALAKTQAALGKLVEARDVALQVLRMPLAKREPRAFTRARKAAKELEADLKPRIPTVKIVVHGGPAAHVKIDGGEVPPLLLGEPVALDPGAHTVVAENADGADDHAEVTLEERDTKSVELTLPAVEARVVEAPPTTEPGPVAPPPPAERTGLSKGLIFGGFGLAAAGLATGAVTGLLAFGKANDVKPQCLNGVCDPAARESLDGARTFATVSNVGFVAAGAGVALGIVGLLLPKRAAEPSIHEEARAFVWFSPTGAGVRGSF